MTGPVGADAEEQPRGSSTDRVVEFLPVLRRRAVIVAACLVLIPALAYMAVAVQPRKHRATSILQSAPLAPPALVTLRGLPSGWFVDPGSNFLGVLARTADVRVAAARRVGKQPADFGSIATRVDPKTDWATISVTAPSGREAVAAARALNEAIAENIHGRVRQSISSLQSDVVARQRQTLDPAARRAIAAQLARFQRFRPEQQQVIQVIEAPERSQPVSNRPWVAAVIGLVVAVLIALRLVRLAERADPRIHDLVQLEELAALPALAAVPRGTDHSPEPFLRLRDALIHLAGEGTGSTLLVSSAMAGDGRTTVAEGLARAYAAAGLTTVLVEADLRRPQLAVRMRLSPGPGLVEVLRGAELTAALQTPAGGAGALQILPAGDMARRRADALSSPQMAAVMRELGRLADVVIVDTPALLEASDALALVEQSSGLIVAARIEHTRRRALQRTLRILEQAGANVHGLVAVDAAAGPSGRMSPVVVRPMEHAQGR